LRPPFQDTVPRIVIDGIIGHDRAVASTNVILECDTASAVIVMDIIAFNIGAIGAIHPDPPNSTLGIIMMDLIAENSIVMAAIINSNAFISVFPDLTPGDPAVTMTALRNAYMRVVIDLAAFYYVHHTGRAGAHMK